MRLLLVLTAVGIALFLARGLAGALKLAMLMIQIQFLIAYPFLGENALGYLSRAFELSRQFLFKWTVNWRFVGEERFLSATFPRALLAAHAALLAFMLSCARRQRVLRLLHKHRPSIFEVNHTLPFSHACPKYSSQAGPSPSSPSNALEKIIRDTITVSIYYFRYSPCLCEIKAE